MIITFEQPFDIKPVAVITSSIYLPFVFKMLVKQENQCKKKFLKVKQFPRVFGTYSLVATVFENFLILKGLYRSKNVLD